MVDTKTDCRLSSVDTREPVKDWFPWEKLRYAVSLSPRECVIYNNWIGTIDDVSDWQVQC